ncbi:MAG: hypothetical protein A3G75_02880 [Verrucomicrobia bacterium RIFCSPLOWO2_12_FULL_64_8]|nr:MAG: hypothetical protein A3G75_02880 [Verrucomicrobia bacterium RIFCSPLOWO2_12_FULL_64_8]
MQNPPAADGAARRTLRDRTGLIAVLLIAGATFAAYANTLRAPFVFDDVASIVDNPTIRRLWPPWEALSPPPEWGFTVSGRPVLNLSFAVNYAISGLGVWSYHALNLLIHVFAGLTLFGLVRRTLARPALSHSFGSRTAGLALAITLLWSLHPMQTEAVTYVVQRAESLMGLFFLLTLYGFVRATDSPRPRRWWILSFVACLLGVGTKELVALAPVMALLYDRTFVSGSFREAWRRHRWPLLALAATWLPLAGLLAGTGGNRGGTSGFGSGASWTGYWLTQFEAVTRYLGLSFWPYPLVFDYGKIAPGGFSATLPWAIPVVGLAAATAWALWRRPVPGFLGAWFFGILAPTSVVPGTLQMIVEHRMYLPLAAVVALVAGAAARRLDGRWLLAATVILAMAAGVATARRNAVYRNDQGLWEDTLAKRPGCARAHNNLGALLQGQGRFEEAIAQYRESLRLDSTTPQTYYNLGYSLLRAGRPAEALAPFEEAVRQLPYYFNAHLYLANALVRLDRASEALAHYEAAIRFDPSPAEAHLQYGVALAALGRWRDALEHYTEAVRLKPDHAEAHSNWGVALLRLNEAAAAVEHFEAALRLKPKLPELHYNLGQALDSLGRRSEAISHYAEAVRLAPDYAAAQLNLGIALGQTGRLAEGIEHLREAARFSPASPEPHTNLGIALTEVGRPAEALSAHEEALRLKPDDARLHYNVGHALLVTGRWDEARNQFAEAVRLKPDFTAARDMLRHLEETPRPP